MDFNGDYRLSGVEFTSYFEENGPVVASMFSYLDANGDYFVTFQELTDAIDALAATKGDEEVVTSAPNGENDGSETVDESEDPEEELANYLHTPGGM